jgi:hypothetical protein
MWHGWWTSDLLLNMVMNHQIEGNFLTSSAIVDFSNTTLMHGICQWQHMLLNVQKGNYRR